jgi:hypothetical protein
MRQKKKAPNERHVWQGAERKQGASLFILFSIDSLNEAFDTSDYTDSNGRMISAVVESDVEGRSSSLV